MTFVDIIDDNNLVDDNTKNMLIELLECAAKYENIDTNITEMSLSFVSKEEIQEINRDYRGKDIPTDVISFALNDEVEDEINIIGLEDEFNSLGDIIICVDIAHEQAQEYNHSFDREIGFLAVHGFLHLLGYDHMNDKDEKEMFGKQEAILEKFGLRR
ncbi:rRNA maturation RNase YbeY [Gemella cuniculi]|uniref:rRNA maturation RNase YbeY n=1 Tax=Gemella cuniculi TaxID=150240 RepID=UPI00042790B2|nr:rRNA maturation RNase YbeY [Gemella cuniculi]